MKLVVCNVSEWLDVRRELDSSQVSIGLVPTMGNLHKGHLSLLERSRCENDVSVLTIFVNPTQFDDPSDLERYPRTLQADLSAAEETGVDYVLLPTFEELYRDHYRYRVSESALSQRFCGSFRPGHFDGVLTVVLKLLNLTRPTRAYFGEKDYQQYLLIRDMAESFFLEMEIVACPIVRDDDGLALSSRNSRLRVDQRRQAALFPALLSSCATCDEAIRALEAKGFEVDYVEDFEGRRLGAVRLGDVRLIDNLPIPRSDR